MRLRRLFLVVLTMFTFFTMNLGFTASASSRTIVSSKWYRGWVLIFHEKHYDVSHSHLSGIGHYLETISYHGQHSGVVSLYSIPGIPKYLAIAVKTSSGYLLAVQTG